MKDKKLGREMAEWYLNSDVSLKEIARYYHISDKTVRKYVEKFCLSQWYRPESIKEIVNDPNLLEYFKQKFPPSYYPKKINKILFRR